MPYNKVQIVSLAIERLGHGPVTAIDTKLAEAAENELDVIYESDIGTNIYSFGTKWVTLSQNVGTPVSTKWNYIYELPSDYIRIIELEPQVDYDIIEDRQLLTNASTLKCKYCFKPDFEKLPSYYVKFLYFSVAAQMAQTKFENASLAQVLLAQAAQAKGMAANLNAQDKPNPYKTNSRYIDTRY